MFFIERTFVTGTGRVVLYEIHRGERAFGS